MLFLLLALAWFVAEQRVFGKVSCVRERKRKRERLKRHGNVEIELKNKTELREVWQLIEPGIEALQKLQVPTDTERNKKLYMVDVCHQQNEKCSNWFDCCDLKCEQSFWSRKKTCSKAVMRTPSSKLMTASLLAALVPTVWNLTF